MRSLFIVVRDKALRRALRTYLAITGIDTLVEDGPDLFSIHPPRGSALIASSPEMSAPTVGYLVNAHDLAVLMLAPLPSEKEREGYERQGALYVPMSLEPHALTEPLRRLLG